ncbi:MAG: rhomboid family intramembrane serine protease [Bacteroidales bacterium]|nr:rhomboid family intramembrane serine protease [Bacteroidales bacterium]
MSQYQPQGFSLLPPAVKHLIIINVLFYAAYYVLLHRYGVDLSKYLALWSLDVPIQNPYGSFRPWQPLTYMFMHANLTHIFFNMFNLWMFGAAMENFWGTRRFVFYYLACGVGAGLIYMLLPGLHVTVGASAAVYGLLLAFGMTFPNEHIYLYFLIPIKTKWFIIGMIAIELLEGIFMTTDGIAHFAHLAGMLIGLLLIMWWRRHPFSRF